jgi:rare lipoprotein A
MKTVLPAARAAFAALVIAGCASTPSTYAPPPAPESESPPAAASAPATIPAPHRRGAYYLDDGPGDNPPTDLDRIPDAEPRLEALHRFANNPYIVFGKGYVPERTLRPFRQRGTASWYGRRFHGQATSTGEPYDMYAMTGAHPTLPLPSYARVTNLANGRTVVIRLNDRGPFRPGRIIDLSYIAAAKLGYAEHGSTTVEVEAILPGVAVAALPRPLIEERPTATRVAAGDAEPSTAAGNLYVQLAAFSLRASAERLRAQLSLELAALDRVIEIFLRDGLYRLHIGPYRTRAEAVAAADRLKRLVDLTPRVVMR